jgi:hypothetical protein
MKQIEEPSTSVEQIERTYGHLLPDALDRGRAALEAFDMADFADQTGRRMTSRSPLGATGGVSYRRVRCR